MSASGLIRARCEISRCRQTAPKCCASPAALATERGVEVCAPVHDAVLICAPLDRLEADIAATRAAMAEASRFVLAGFELTPT